MKKRSINIKREKWGNRDANIRSFDTAYSPALEVIVHATRHILNKEKVNINDTSKRADLINRILEVKEIFEKTLSGLELYSKNIKTDALI